VKRRYIISDLRDSKAATYISSLPNGIVASDIVQDKGRGVIRITASDVLRVKLGGTFTFFPKK
jgi:hypothetical protein